MALPGQLFYNTGISTYIWVLTNRKEEHRKGKIQLIDAREFYVKMRKSLGNKRNQSGTVKKTVPIKSARLLKSMVIFNMMKPGLSEGTLT